ncbi:hypothetical protein MNBD_UNCLBAC01-921 [hydrothermal vent metagenome]|uniref:Ice-binding protein C-terminal domain-containing protein n=1 Tax=hydrothermal vent metagenome TaxID=652676 RepID=A0A3B1DEX0_9ZZZZ
MKKLLLTFALVAGLIVSASNADAIQISLDVSSLGLGSGDGVTQLFDEFAFNSQTTSTDFDGIPGGAFTDVGNVRITDFNAATSTDQEGINTAWTLTAVWTDLSGTSTVIGPGSLDYTYTSGTMKIYAAAGVPNNFDGDGDLLFEGADDDTGFTTGTEIASLSLISGSGFVRPTPLGLTGASKLFWQFDTMETGIWKDEFGNDLKDSIPLVLAIADANMNNLTSGGPGVLWSDQNGSVAINNTVSPTIPEPATMLLFGSGLIGFIAKRKKRA